MTYDYLTGPNVRVHVAKTDVAQLIARSLESQRPYIQAFGVVPNFRIPLFEGQPDVVGVAGELKFSPMDVSGAYFTIDADSLLMSRMVEVGIGLCAYFAAANRDAISLVLEKQDTHLSLTFITSGALIENQPIDEIFKPGFGSLAMPDQQYVASGLEGYIFYTLSTIQSLPVSVTISEDTKELRITVQLS